MLVDRGQIIVADGFGGCVVGLATVNATFECEFTFSPSLRL